MPVWDFFYGVFHQGGVISSLVEMQMSSTTFQPSLVGGVEIDPEYGIDLIYMNTYMPPRFLLAQPRTGSWPIHLHDVGSDVEKLLSILDAFRKNYCQLASPNFDMNLFLLLPSTTEIPSEVASSYEFEIAKKFWPHFSSEFSPKSIGEFFLGSLNLYHLSNKFSC